MLIKCQKCGYEWDYKGNMTKYACCPNCQRKTKIVPIEGGVDDSK